jgi:hypothetical protein
MKGICQRLKLSAFCAFRIRILVLCAIVFLTGVPLSFCRELVFQNPSRVTGELGQDNAVDLFPDVTSTIDAHVQLTQHAASNVIVNKGFMVTGHSLPVKLLSFTVKGLNTDKVVLNWMTAQEKNSSHFTIEKSLDGKDFSDAGIVFSIGTSEQPKQYTFTDKLRAEERGTIYYRLKMVDVEGKSTRSSIRIARIGREKP